MGCFQIFKLSVLEGCDQNCKCSDFGPLAAVELPVSISCVLNKLWSHFLEVGSSYYEQVPVMKYACVLWCIVGNMSKPVASGNT